MKLKKTAFIFATVLLAGCSSLQSKIADIQTNNLTKTLPDGSTLHYNTNVTPTAPWGCRKIGDTLYYDWSSIQMEGQFHWGGPSGLLLDKGIGYLSANDFKANYANLGIPEENSFSFAVDKMNSSNTSYTGNGKATVTFYQCKLINPTHTAGATEKTGVSVGINAPAKNPIPPSGLE